MIFLGAMFIYSSSWRRQNKSGQPKLFWYIWDEILAKAK